MNERAKVGDIAYDTPLGDKWTATRVHRQGRFSSKPFITRTDVNRDENNGQHPTTEERRFADGGDGFRVSSPEMLSRDYPPRDTVSP